MDTYVDLTTFIKETEVIKLEKGDILIVRLLSLVTHEERARIKEYLDGIIPKNVKYILCSDAMDFKVYRPPFDKYK